MSRVTQLINRRERIWGKTLWHQHMFHNNPARFIEYESLKRLSELWLHPDLTLITQWTAWQFGKFSIYLFRHTFHPSLPAPYSVLWTLIYGLHQIRLPSGFWCLWPGEIKMGRKDKQGIHPSAFSLMLCNVWVTFFLAMLGLLLMLVTFSPFLFTITFELKGTPNMTPFIRGPARHSRHFLSLTRQLFFIRGIDK